MNSGRLPAPSAVLDALREKPGLPVVEIQRATGIPDGTLHCTLLQLRRNRAIKFAMVGARRLYFLADAEKACMERKKREYLLVHPLTKAVLDAVVAGSGRSAEELADATGRSLRVVYYHLTKLLHARLITRKGARYYPNAHGANE